MYWPGGSMLKLCCFPFGLQRREEAPVFNGFPFQKGQAFGNRFKSLKTP